MNGLSIQQAFRGKNVLLTGATGFVGKIWLCMALARIPEIGKIFVLTRGKSGLSPLQRIEKIVNHSPVFKILHDAYAGDLEEFLFSRLEVIEGDVGEPDFGLPQRTVSSLAERIDLILNVAGLVDFRPDLRKAFKTNVLGALHALETARSFGCPLLHVSTAFVAGGRDGRIEEKIPSDYSPSRPEFRASRDYSDLERLVASSVDRGWDRAGQDRAEEGGWPNAYSYTKSLAESLLIERAGGVPVSIFRPTIVESAAAFPFPGWNEGVTTCAPLSYLLSRWTRFVPIKPGNLFDLVPVDTVCEQLTVVAAALLSGSAHPVYHCGTSDSNPLNLRFAVELMGVGQRAHLKASGRSAFEKNVLSLLQPVVVKEDGFFTASKMKRLATILMDAADLGAPHMPDGVRRTLEAGKKALHKIKWDLVKAERILETFRPYLSSYNYRFVTRNLRTHAVEEPEFRFRPESISWSDYIVNVHEPGLRKWCYPLMEGRLPEEYRPKYRCRLNAGNAGENAPPPDLPAKRPRSSVASTDAY